MRLAGIRRPIAGEVRLDGTPLSTWALARGHAASGCCCRKKLMEFWGSVLDYVCLGPLSSPPLAVRMGSGGRASGTRATRAHGSDPCGRPGALEAVGRRAAARAPGLILTQDPVFYLLDEPLQHLDLRHQAAGPRMLCGPGPHWQQGGCHGSPRSALGAAGLRPCTAALRIGRRAGGARAGRFDCR